MDKTIIKRSVIVLGVFAALFIIFIFVADDEKKELVKGFTGKEYKSKFDGYYEEEDLLEFTNDYVIDDGLEFSNKLGEISLEAIDYYDDHLTDGIYNEDVEFLFTRGVLLKNTGQVPILIKNIKFQFEDMYDSWHDVDDLWDVSFESEDYDWPYNLSYSDYYEENMIVYPGEEFPYAIQGKISYPLLIDSDIPLNLSDEWIDPGVFSVEYAVHHSDIENYSLGKELKERKQSPFVVSDLELEYTDDDYHSDIITGKITYEGNEESSNYFYPYVKIYEDILGTDEQKLVALAIGEYNLSLEKDEEIEFEMPIFTPFLSQDYGDIEDLDGVEVIVQEF